MTRKNSAITPDFNDLVQRSNKRKKTTRQTKDLDGFKIEGLGSIALDFDKSISEKMVEMVNIKFKLNLQCRKRSSRLYDITFENLDPETVHDIFYFLSSIGKYKNFLCKPHKIIKCKKRKHLTI